MYFTYNTFHLLQCTLEARHQGVEHAEGASTVFNTTHAVLE